jgi:hypothetical protein
MSAQFVVVHDPTGSHPIGDVIADDKLVVARRRKVVLLPADDRMFYSATPGFCYRPWGNGWNYDAMQGERGCPMMLSVGPHHPWIYWSALVLPIRKSEPLHGMLRVVGNSAAGGMSLGMTQDQIIQKLQEYNVGEQSGVVVSGRNNLSVTQDGMLSLSIHGVCRNTRVMWSAVSIAADKHEVPGSVPV